MNKSRVVAIARSENVFFFRSLGFEAYLLDEATNIKELLADVTKDTQIIVIDEKLQMLINEYRERLSDKAFPIFIALPIDGKATGQGLDKLRLDVEKAIGLKLF